VKKTGKNRAWAEVRTELMGGMIERFEDLIAWQKARVLTRRIYQETRRGEFARDFGLARQIQRAAVSIMSNIAEGFDRGSRAEFQQFLSIAKASCAEVRSQLYVAFDIGYIDQERLDELLSRAEEVSRIVGGLRASVERQRYEHRF
jgi:four helix bundle protein